MTRRWTALVRIYGLDNLRTGKEFFTQGGLERYIKRIDEEGKRTGTANVFYKDEWIYSVLEPERC